MAESAGPVALDADEADESEDEAGAGFDSPLGRGDPLEACSSLHECFPQTSIFLKCQSPANVLELCAEGCRRISHSALPCSVVHGALASMLESCIWLDSTGLHTMNWKLPFLRCKRFDVLPGSAPAAAGGMGGGAAQRREPVMAAAGSAAASVLDTSPASVTAAGLFNSGSFCLWEC